MSSAPSPPAGTPEPGSGELPPAVRGRVIALADETLAAMPENEVPASLKAVRRFTPAKRARLGAASLGAALTSEPGFRAAVVARIRAALPAVVSALESGSEAPAVPALDLAAIAYLLETPDWLQRLETVRPAADGSRQDRDRQERLRRELESARREARAEVERLQKELGAARREAEELRRRLGRAEAVSRRATEAQEIALQRVADAHQEREVLERELSAQVRRLSGRLRDAEQSAATARRGLRSERDAQTARLRVLLDTVTAAATGLRRELDLPGGAARPSELVAADQQGASGAEGGSLLATLRRGRPATDPSVVDDVLTVPGIHVIVDGYNVTKLGYPTLTLEEQRGRLLSGLGTLAARASGAELTCVFDATTANARPAAVAAPRGVRVLFSAVGELADELIVRLAGGEPDGRPLVVVTNDREVIAAVSRAGGESLPSEALIRRLERS